ncbi:alpha/beta hydrolase [Limnoglobus roseus]|uniref:Alpha/beta hydrolase n=1 Tax=Limnoglobus roseus TaxID=2598579 RepID=A0A5C1AQE7_9BACT|nr:alpha/beta hydrolase [Limnoglobus roseus]QEL20273.1 alpha/beta hydrolase [Limnoglobus roseus]
MRFASPFLALALVATPGLAQTPKSNFPEGTTVEKDVAYGPHERNKLDVAVPKGDGPFPLLIWIHGGGWEAGDKGGFGPFAGQVARGYAVATINYRFAKHAIFPAQIEDAKAAVRFLRTNAKKYHFDADHFGVGGLSAGGHLSALLGTSGGMKELEGDKEAKPDASRVQAVLDLFGPTDLGKLSPAVAKDNPVTRLLGGDTGTKKDLAKAGTPQTYVSKDDPPFLIIHGDADTLVPVKQSEDLQAALTKGGVKSELIVVKGAGHGPGISSKENSEKINAFFDASLKKASGGR